MCWQAALLFFSPFLCTSRRCSGVSAWHSSYCEHDLGWRPAPDADDLCHWGGFQSSTLTAVLTNLRKTHTLSLNEHIQPAHMHSHTHTRPHKNAHIHCECLCMIHFDYGVLKQQVTGFPLNVICVVGLCSEAVFGTQRELAGNMPNLQVSYPVTDIEWAEVVMSSSCKSSIPLSGWIRLYVTTESQISVAGHSGPPLGNVYKITSGMQGCLIKASFTYFKTHQQIGHHREVVSCKVIQII